MMRIDFYGDWVSDKIGAIKIIRGINLNIKSSDYNLVNFESPIKDTSLPTLKSGPSIQQDADGPRWLKQHGFNVFTLANNHIMDYGEKAARETKATLGDDKCVGIGVGKEAYKPLLLEKMVSRLPSWLWQNCNLAWFMILSLKLTIMVVLGSIIRA